MLALYPRDETKSLASKYSQTNLSSTMPSGMYALQALIQFVMKIPIYCIKMDYIMLLFVAG